jgi:hypothetical protein
LTRKAEAPGAIQGQRLLRRISPFSMVRVKPPIKHDASGCVTEDEASRQPLWNAESREIKDTLEPTSTLE